MTSERLPAPITARAVQVVGGPRSVAAIHEDVDHIRAIAAPSPARLLRRIAFVWFRVFVHETKHGKAQRVTVRIPIPIPLIGAFFPYGLPRSRALAALALADGAEEPAQAVTDYLDSVMGFEFVRVDERKGERHQLVVVGFD